MYVITFYSFKGGVGRTMALVNVAAELVRRGRKVLVVDFDLEAPGLETYKHLGPEKPHPGIVEYVTEFRRTYAVPNLLDYIYETKPIGKKGGRLWVMPAGRRDKAYRKALGELDWQRLYRDQQGFLLFEDTKEGWKQELNLDYVLIDSRTGDTDVLGICTRQLPDSVVLMFTPNEQNLVGLENVCRDIRREATEGLKKNIRLHFVAANVPDLDDEKGVLRRQLQTFRERLDFKELSGVIERYENLNLLDQSVFTLDRRHSRLACSYRRLLKKLLKDNHLVNRDGAVLFLTNYIQMIDQRERMAQDEDCLDRVMETWRASDEIDAIIGNFLDDSMIFFLAANCRILEGEDGSAGNLLNRVLKLDPDVSEAYFQRALCTIRTRRDTTGAVDDLLKFLGVPDADPINVLRAFRELHSIAPDRIVEAARLPAISRVPEWKKTEICELLLDSEEGISEAVRIAPSEKEYLILARRWKTAIKQMEDEEIGNCGDFYEVFDWVMAYWGDANQLSEEKCRHCLRVWDAQESGDPETYREVRLGLSVAILLWGIGDSPGALKKLDAVAALSKDFRAWKKLFSPWRYREVSEEQFLEDCQLLRRMFQGEPIRPAFLGRAAAVTPA